MCLKPTAFKPWSSGKLLFIKLDNKLIPIGEYTGWDYVLAKNSFDVIYDCNGFTGRIALERIHNKLDILVFLEEEKLRDKVGLCCEIVLESIPQICTLNTIKEKQ